MAHQKHAKLTKPIGGQYGRNELSIMGAPCSEIKTLSGLLMQQLQNRWSIGYIDSEHNAPTSESWSAIDNGALRAYTDKISFKQLESRELEVDFSDLDLALINGNHYQAEAQIAFVHPKKDLQKKQDKLTHVILVILHDEVATVPEYLVAHINNAKVPVYKASEIEKIVQLVDSWLTLRKPELNGLVLAGGKSTRMQQDKAMLNYHGKPHQSHLVELLQPHCRQVFVSSRDEAHSAELSHPAIADKFVGLGPYGGILSAFMHNPNTAWLVVAVDLPFLDADTLGRLVAHRNPSKLATCFIDPQNEFPEPLITIWEPKAYARMLHFLAKGYSCPRKVLINSDIELLTDRNPQALTNVNTPEELDSALKIIRA